jgi:hypothetical protein
LRIVVLILVLLLAIPGVSFAKAMTYPGNAPFKVRAVEWVRENGGAGIVNVVETWWYSHHAPPSTGAPADRTPGDASSAVAKASLAATLPKVALLPNLAPVAGEGVWRVASTTSHKLPALYTTWFRPDPRHTPVVAGAALIPQSTDVLHLVAGTREPVPGLRSPENYKVPKADRSKLVAGFNSGFKIKDSHGGWFADGHTAVPLVPGAASIVIKSDGRAVIGSWGNDVSMTPDVVAVRQNLGLVVQNGQPASGLMVNAHDRWGSRNSQFQYTWRSSIGIDAHGDLIYVAGKGLTLAALAKAMVSAGVRTGMQLDIHPPMVTFNSFTHTAHHVVGHKLLTKMTRTSSRYLSADQRDFFYVTTR